MLTTGFSHAVEQQPIREITPPELVLFKPVFDQTYPNLPLLCTLKSMFEETRLVMFLR